MNRIPLSVLTGFLGSGKTTLLQSLLADPRLSDAAVVINELGEIGIDHLIVREVVEGVVLLSSGCLCCSTRADLVTTLRRLNHQRAARTIPRFGRMIIETTGLADPAPILQTLVKEPLVAEHYRLDGTIVTIDAVHAHTQFDRHAESIRQAAFADRLVITKLDLLANKQELRTLEARLASINASAPILHAVRGRLDAGVLFDAGLYNGATRRPDVGRWLRMRQDDCAGRRHRYTETARAIHDDGIRSFYLIFEQPVDWDRFTDCLHAFIEQHGRDVLRIKGILNIASESRPVVVHGVHHVFYPPQSLASWPSEDRRSRLVFITSRIERAAVERVFREHHLLHV